MQHAALCMCCILVQSQNKMIFFLLRISWFLVIVLTVESLYMNVLLRFCRQRLWCFWVKGNAPLDLLAEVLDVCLINSLFGSADVSVLQTIHGGHLRLWQKLKKANVSAADLICPSKKERLRSTEPTLDGRTLCRGLWMTKSMLKSLKNSETVIVPSSSLWKQKPKGGLDAEERRWRTSWRTTYLLGVAEGVFQLRFKQAVLDGCEERKRSSNQQSWSCRSAEPANVLYLNRTQLHICWRNRWCVWRSESCSRPAHQPLTSGGFKQKRSLHNDFTTQYVP